MTDLLLFLRRAKATLRTLPLLGALYRALAFAGHWLCSGPYRRAYAMQRNPAPGLFQPYTVTSVNRYPRMFDYVHKCVGDGAGHHILSFGCSSGEEVFSLAARFPQAKITGIDINPENIALCRKRWLKQGADPRLCFTLAASASGTDTYDAIFAMAVFRHGALGARPASCADYIHFAAFESCLATLGRALKPGGLLALAHSNFRLADCRYAGAFLPLQTFSLRSQYRTPVYGPDDTLSEALCENTVYRRVADIS